MRTPEIGDIVRYRNPIYDSNQAEHAAIVTSVKDDGLVSLTVFLRGGTDQVWDVEQGTEDDRFYYPEGSTNGQG